MGLLGSGSSVVVHMFGNQYYGTVTTDPAKGTEWFWAIGVLVTLCGATLTIIGFMVQKQSHSAIDALDAAPRKPYYWMEPRWLLGGSLWLGGNLICWVALGLAPQSILASINCWNILITLIIAPWLLGEPVTMRTALSGLILACGTGWVVMCGPRAYQQHTVVSIVEALGKTQSILAFFVTTSFLMAMAILAYCRSRSGIAPTLTHFQFTGIAAIFAWYAMTLSKSTAKVMVASVQLHEQLYLNPIFWALAAGLPVCAAAQIHFLNMALKHGEAVVVIPMYEALSMTGQIVIGGLVFQELVGLSLRAHAWFWPGVAVVLLGIASLACEVRRTGKAWGTIEETAPLIAAQAVLVDEKVVAKQAKQP